MPPKGKPKSKAAKARAKANKLALKALTAVAANGEAPVEGAEGGAVAIPEPAKPKSDAVTKKVKLELELKSFEDLETEYKGKKRKAEAELAEVEAMEKANQKQVDEAKGEYDAAQADIAAKSKEELEAAAAYKALSAQKGQFGTKLQETRGALYEAQKKLAMLEVLQVNHEKTKQLEETRKKAQEAAAAAKEMFLQQKLKEKEALEATRRALAATRAEVKGKGRGAKKTDTGATKDGYTDDAAETQAATQAADID